MSETTIAKNGDHEVQVPQAWRPTLAAIVDTLIKGGEPSLPQVTLQSPHVDKSAREHSRVWRALEKVAG